MYEQEDIGKPEKSVHPFLDSAVYNMLIIWRGEETNKKRNLENRFPNGKLNNEGQALARNEIDSGQCKISSHHKPSQSRVLSISI